MNHPIDTIQYERDFKVLCDGLLRYELGGLVQTYASAGPDGGIDAEFNGSFCGINGRWVFQYKFRSPAEALSVRRRRLRQCYVTTKSRKSEFDKAGVVDADGYVLLTNVPVTVILVRELADGWRAREHAGPLCVWDPSRINELMKGREHLARSWSGAREARCRQAIVLPLWQWLETAVAVTTNWTPDPLWPLEVRRYQHPVAVGAFHQNFSWRYGLSIAPRTDPLREAMRDPQFHYASTIMYPRALKPLAVVVDAIDRLAGLVHARIDGLQVELIARVPQLQGLADECRTEAIRALAYCVLENRWGFPMRGLHSIRDGRLLVHATHLAWEAPALTDMEPILDELVREIPHGVVDPDVVNARAEVARLVYGWWERLWHVVSLGTDAEHE